jgi:hypothetical protein
LIIERHAKPTNEGRNSMSTPALISRLHEALARYTTIAPVPVADLREALELVAELQSTLQALTTEIAAGRITPKSKAYVKAVALLDQFKVDTK